MATLVKLQVLEGHQGGCDVHVEGEEDVPVLMLGDSLALNLRPGQAVTLVSREPSPEPEPAAKASGKASKAAKGTAGAEE